MLSGCDFLPNIRGIGIKKAHALVAKHRSVAAVLAVLHGDKKIHVPPGYDDDFRRAFWTFRHARVYDPALRRLRPLNPMPEELEPHDGGVDTAFLGAAVADDVAVEVAEGAWIQSRGSRSWCRRARRNKRGGRPDVDRRVAAAEVSSRTRRPAR